MVKGAGPIKPTDIQPVVPSLQQKEAQKTEQQRKEKLSSADAARLASQAGFQRLDRKQSKRALDIGDSSKAPIPLPDDEVDPDAWSQEGLESAQGGLTLAASQFEEIAGAPEGVDIGAAVVGSSFMPTGEDIAALQSLAERTAPEPRPMLDEVTSNTGKLFGIRFPEETPVGHRVLAVGLVVAGEQGSVQVTKGKLDEQVLAGGVERVTKKGNQAVGEAQKMTKGINKELSVQRTFVHKR